MDLGLHLIQIIVSFSSRTSVRNLTLYKRNPAQVYVHFLYLR
jgi:hypothetical protein